MSADRLQAAFERLEAATEGEVHTALIELRSALADYLTAIQLRLGALENEADTPATFGRELAP